MKGEPAITSRLCQWRLGTGGGPEVGGGIPRRLRRCAEGEPVDPGIRQQSEVLLAALKEGSPPRPRRDRRTGRDRAARPVSGPRGADEARAQAAGRSLAGPDPRPGPATKESSSARPAVPRAGEAFRSGSCRSTEPMAPHLDELLGPSRTVKEVLDSGPAVHEQGKPPVWFLPLNEPIAPHLDGLPGQAARDETYGTP